jgi:hypothetical protein
MPPLFGAARGLSIILGLRYDSAVRSTMRLPVRVRRNHGPYRRIRGVITVLGKRSLVGASRKLIRSHAAISRTIAFLEARVGQLPAGWLEKTPLRSTSSLQEAHSCLRMTPSTFGNAAG